MAKVTFLHISDLHYDTSNANDISLIFQALQKDLQDRAQAGFKPNFVLFSGDLVKAGGPQAPFAGLRSAIIDPLLSSLGLAGDQLFIAPGNHDINRDDVRKNQIVQTGFTQSLTSREACNTFYDSQTGAANNLYFSRLNAFTSFSEAFGRPHRIRRNGFFDTYSVNFEGVQVGIACLNTAWLSSQRIAKVGYCRTAR